MEEKGPDALEMGKKEAQKAEEEGTKKGRGALASFIPYYFSYFS